MKKVLAIILIGIIFCGIVFTEEIGEGIGEIGITITSITQDVFNSKSKETIKSDTEFTGIELQLTDEAIIYKVPLESWSKTVDGNYMLITSIEQIEYKIELFKDCISDYNSSYCLGKVKEQVINTARNLRAEKLEKTLNWQDLGVTETDLKNLISVTELNSEKEISDLNTMVEK